MAALHRVAELLLRRTQVDTLLDEKALGIDQDQRKKLKMFRRRVLKYADCAALAKDELFEQLWI